MRTRWLLAIAIGIASMLGCVRGDRTAPAHSASFSLVERVEEAETSFDETFFRSVRKDGRLVNAVTMEGRTELSLTPPLPSRLRYRLRVPDAPILRFATGAATLGDETLAAPLELRTVAEIISHSWMDATCSSTSAGKRIF